MGAKQSANLENVRGSLPGHGSKLATMVRATKGLLCSQMAYKRIVVFFASLVFIVFGGLKAVLLLHLSKSLGLFIVFVMLAIYPVFYSVFTWLTYAILWLLVYHSKDLLVTNDSPSGVSFSTNGYDGPIFTDDDDDDYNTEYESESERKIRRFKEQTKEPSLTSRVLRNVFKSWNNGGDNDVENGNVMITNGDLEMVRMNSGVVKSSPVSILGAKSNSEEAEYDDDDDDDDDDDFTTPTEDFFENANVIDTPEANDIIYMDDEIHHARDKTIKKESFFDRLGRMFTLGQFFPSFYLFVALLDCLVFILRYIPLIYLPGPVLIIVSQAGLPILLVLGVFYLNKSYRTNHYLSAASIFFILFFSVWPHYTKTTDNSQQHYMFWISLFLACVSMIPDCFLQLYKEKIMSDYRCNYIKLAAWSSMIKIPLGLILLPVVLISLPEPAMNVNTAHFSQYMTGAGECLFKSTISTVNEISNSGHTLLVDLFHGNHSSYEVPTTIAPVGIYSNVSRFDYFHGFRATRDNIINSNNTNFTMIGGAYNWELEAKCDSSLLCYFFGFALLSVIVDVSYMLLINAKGADYAWFCSVLQFFPATFFFSLGGLIGDFVAEPVLSVDIVAGAVSFYSFLVFLNTERGSVKKSSVS